MPEDEGSYWDQRWRAGDTGWDIGGISPPLQQYFEQLPGRGKLAGLLFDRDFAAGPPHGGHKTEYRQLLEKKITLKTLASCYNSIKPRTGTELFFIAVRND